MAELNDPAEKYFGKMDEILDYERDKDLNLYQRIHKVMEEVWYIKKDGDAGHYSTVEHDDVTRKLRPSMVRHGLVAHIHEINDGELKTLVTQKTNRHNEEYDVVNFYQQSRVIIKIVNVDNPDEYITVPAFGSSKDQNPLNISGKILSYAIKYALVKTFMLETGDREESESAGVDNADLDAVFIFNMLGKELFGDDWEEMAKHKIYKVTRGKTAEASRAPTSAITAAIKNLYKLKKEREANPEKDIEEINKEVDNDTDDDIISEFSD